MARLLRISLFGAMPSGEEWSINPVFGIGGSSGIAVTPTIAAQLADSIANSTPAGGIISCWNSTTTFVGARVEARAIDGTLETQGEAVRSTPLAGTGTQPLPFQTSVCVSLRSSTPGASGRGRLYLPATGITISTTTLRPNSTVVAGVCTAMAGWLLSIEQFIDVRLPGDNFLAVWSRKNDALHRIVSVQAGDVLDVQRRRRDQLIETYSAAAYAGTP